MEGFPSQRDAHNLSPYIFYHLEIELCLVTVMEKLCNSRKNRLGLICIPFVFRGVDGGAGVGRGDIDLSLR